MILRFLVLGVVLVVAYGGVSVASRRPGRGTDRVPPGITLIEADGCRQCDVAKRRFGEAGVAVRVLDVQDASTRGMKTLTVPTVFVGTADGHFSLVRRGSAVLSDFDAIVAKANDAHT
ncbi:MAG: glutaredoxin family protein [Acidimicrobiia bacterium]